MFEATKEVVQQSPVTKVSMSMSVADAQIIRSLLGRVSGSPTGLVGDVHRIREAITEQTGLKYKAQFSGPVRVA